MFGAVRFLAQPPRIPRLLAPSVRISRATGSLAEGNGRCLWRLIPNSPREDLKKRWRALSLSCFRDREDNSSTSNNGFNSVKIILTGETDKPQLDLSVTQKKGWVCGIQKAIKRILQLQREPWSVPWTAETIVQVMLLWIASFWFVGSWVIPFLAHAAGFSKESLTHRGQALYSLLTDIAEGLAGIVILHRCLSRFRPLPTGWFSFSLQGSWLFDVGLGCVLFPFVNFLSQINIKLLPLLPSPPVGVSSVEQSIIARDPIAMVLYAAVVLVCAPVWEEIVFRGFLLPSLTRYMSLWRAIVLSAFAFALAHFNAQRLLPLVFLGVIMGAVFAKSRNLLASMFLHGLWNGFVFLDLMK
ncbi:hypothetical protein HPP92_003560 [Vanilla planifolia]|uniref:CAAX prenyl protease 2/Lysostaphin resistance protein A-like domain-containing protein n=1 Tax=Vanilla planifolia TaxID=51239 RepID=A0A835VHP6_VANPL|nr:hypothetical protein HPP92_003943 [Vanilla planifolia]KAG0503488.1 hypothetical protein HPP92_003560 [Vanilla planifolia]